MFLASMLAIATLMIWSAIVPVQASKPTTNNAQVSVPSDALIASINTLTVNVVRLSTILETATKQVSASSEISVETRGVVKTWGKTPPHRAPSVARDRLNLPISGAVQ